MPKFAYIPGLANRSALLLLRLLTVAGYRGYFSTFNHRLVTTQCFKNLYQDLLAIEFGFDLIDTKRQDLREYLSDLLIQ